jgi:type IV pilus assembly protein PilY1
MMTILEHIRAARGATPSITSARAACLLTAALGAALPSHADDSELYQISGFDFGPDYYANVLFIIDTSGSMNESVDENGNGWIDAGERTRLQIVKDVVTNFLNELEYVNVGLMRFDSGYSVGGRFSRSNFREGGGMVIHAIEDISASRDDILRKLNALEASGTTQLSETMYEAASYMMGWPVYFGDDTYAGYFGDDASPDSYSPSVPESRDADGDYLSPIGECQENHIVYLTDGQPQFDSEITDVVPTWPGFEGICTDNPDWYLNSFNVDGDGDCLDDIAAYLHENDLYGDETDGVQKVITHTIGFFQDNDLLADTARRGGGKYYLADDAESLLNTLESIFVDVNETGATLTSPGVSVNAFDRTTHLDQLYYSVFQATGRARWMGNLKRYRLGESDGGALVVVDLEDADAVDQDTGFFREDSISWWSQTNEPDGFSVSAGGAAQHLTAYRNTLTEYGGQVYPLTSDDPDVVEYLIDLLDIDLLIDVFSADIEKVGYNALNLRTVYDVVASVVDWAQGKDIRDADADQDFAEARKEIGDPMHSKPLVVTYGLGEQESNSVIFFGSNEGYLHAISSETGEELSAFMPLEMLPNLDDWFANQETTDRIYGVDGPIDAWVQDGGDGDIGEGDSVYVYFGLRRGGNYYYALDYTNPSDPRFMWKISPDSPGFAQLGQSWSSPVRTRIDLGSFGSPDVQDVLIFGGGFDERQDDYSAWAPDTTGNAIFMVNAYTGELVWSGSAANLDDTSTQAYFADMVNAITGDIRVLDLDDDGLADRLYAADLGGRVWRFDIHNPDEEGESFSVTGGVMASLGGASSEAPTDNRRFYYAPDVATGTAGGRNFFNITVASGYRSHPKDLAIDDHFYVIRDYYPFEELGQSEDPPAEYVSRYGYVHDDMVDIGQLQKEPDALVAGHRMGLDFAPGEKVLSETRIFQNKANFTSYLPESDQVKGCFAALGGGQLYSVDLSTGGIGVEQLDKPGIPPEIVYIFTEDKDQGYVPPTCYGDYCIDPEEDGENPPGGDDGEDDERPQGTGRDIGCVVGPESCNAATREVPVKTFWNQVDTDDAT